MKATLAAILLAGIGASAMAQTYVNPHVRKDGTYVQGHVRSAPNNTTIDNYSTRGNVNPYTGQAGTVNPYQQPSPYNPYAPKF